MWLGVPNWIIDNSDYKLSKFDHWLRYESDSNGTFESTIAILIYFQLKSPNFLLKRLKNWLNDQKYWLKDKNCWFLLKGNLFEYFRSFSIHFWLKSIDFELFDLFLAAGINFVTTIWIWTTNLDWKSGFHDDLNPISNKILLKVNLITLA